MSIKKIYVADFETTVFDGQDSTEVWAAALVELYTENVLVFNSIDKFFEYVYSLKHNAIVYFHNLKFDGSFILDYLMRIGEYKQAYSNDNGDISWMSTSDMPDKSYRYLISDKGQWYTIIIKNNRFVIDIRDSLKLLPFSVADIGNAFKTKHKKLSIEYKGIRKKDGYITDEEKEYIKNDVLVVKEALEILYSEGHNKLTIGSCCLSEFKSNFPKPVFNDLFPNLYESFFPNTRDNHDFGYVTIGEYIRASYKGGYCYLVEGKENKVYKNGVTLDVNSLYPSVMSGEYGKRYPVSYPINIWEGNYIPPISENHYYFIRIKTRFRIRKNYLPTIQKKGTAFYRGNEYLKTSDFYNRKKNTYTRYYIDYDGKKCDTRMEMVLTMTDYILFREHYEVSDFEILDGIIFQTESASYIFDKYIEKYKKQKMTSKGALRTLAKLYLNNLYGKMASSLNSSFKVAFLGDDNILHFKTIEEYHKKPGYIPIGSAITSYARDFTIRAAQKNYYGSDKDGFIYADTDSLHINLPIEKIKGVKLSDTEFCHWKLECTWDEAIYVRQKTYIEKIDGEYDIKCAGMPDRAKSYIAYALTGRVNKKIFRSFTKEGQKWVKNNKDFTLSDFKIGLQVPGKLIQRRLPGGVVLQDSLYTMR